ncbi:MAG: hypothetical protein LBL39_00230 [Planctomycetaceae bacterium]|jgi:hypothetical protein|nr:hypothetical protein [Planctomycetaceae bacterium]
MRRLIFVLLLLPILTGCGGNNPQGRVPVRGEVNLDGKPLEQGDILFSSVEGMTPAVATGSLIKNGKFSLPAEHGLIPDQTYSVQFRSVEVIPATNNETTNKTSDITNPAGVVGLGATTRNIMPDKYGVDSKEKVTATKKSPNVFQFDLTSKTDK